MSMRSCSPTRPSKTGSCEWRCPVLTTTVNWRALAVLGLVLGCDGVVVLALRAVWLWVWGGGQ